MRNNQKGYPPSQADKNKRLQHFLFFELNQQSLKNPSPNKVQYIHGVVFKTLQGNHKRARLREFVVVSVKGCFERFSLGTVC
jgi:hypothetical protein